MKRTLLLLGVLAGLAAVPAGAVRLDPDGRGQALIFPYYRADAREGPHGWWFTYLSIFNHDASAKALRVRVREGRRGQEIASFNLFLAVGDGWAGAIGATSGNSVDFFSYDPSCASVEQRPYFPYEINLSAAAAALQDGAGADAARAQEGWVEVVEMASLAGASAAAAAMAPNGQPADCAALRGTLPPGELLAPGGGLSGTLTILDVRGSYDLTVRAEALAELASRPSYRRGGDAHPGFDAAEIDPASFIVAGGKEYRLAWRTGREAVASVLTRRTLLNEYVIDAETASATDWVITRPFAAAACETFDAEFFDREERGIKVVDFEGRRGSLCHSATIGVVGYRDDPAAASRLFASRNLHSGANLVHSSFSNGWGRMHFGGFDASGGLTSLGGSTAYDRASGSTTSGAFRVVGTPVVGFAARSFVNGSIACRAGICLGNYGGSFPHRYEMLVVPAP